MQIDFHHATTYVIARIAGFEQPEAETIAYASQYVDDATSEGTVYFDNRAVYNRISSAHKMLDYRNTKALANHQVWLAFHFLPGNGGLAAGQNPEGKFIQKIVCRPDSPVAQDMVHDTIVNQSTTYALHRLGIVMHIYADTWAHQGFAGVLHRVNDVENAEERGNTKVFGGALKRFLYNALDDAIPPLGHGRANVFPDMPFLSWRYRNGHEELVERDNTEDFCTAANKMCIAMQRFIEKDARADVPGIDDNNMAKMRNLFAGIKEKNGDVRHQQWLQIIRDGEFSFGSETLNYHPRGAQSWKAKALGTSHDLPVHKYDENFLLSDWKLFHDAIQAHRFHVIHDVLPKYGICAA